MSRFILRRFGHMVLIMFLVSILGFIIIQLPPGDYLSVLQHELEEQRLTEEQIRGTLRAVEERFGLGRPFYVQYYIWMSGFFKGDLGYSMTMMRSVNELIGERIILTILISFTTLVFAFAVSIPIGIYSAVRKYSIGDYIFTFIGFIGLATPNFLLALILMFVAVTVFHAGSIGGLFSQQYIAAPWSIAKALDLIKHLWLPVIIVGTSGTAGTIRVVRARMLDTLGELASLYQVSDLVFVGGSLVPHGGHNLVEPAALARPILAGPHLHNFQSVSDALRQASGMIVTRSAEELRQALRRLFRDPLQAQALGRRARAVFEENQGAVRRTADLIELRWSRELTLVS